MKTTLHRDNTTLRLIPFEDRVAPCHQRQLPDGVDWCVCMLQPARTTIDGVSYMASCRTAMKPVRTTIDGVSYMASCRTAMSRGQRRVFESHARQMEQHDRLVCGVLTAQSCDNLLHYDVEPNASSDIMIVSDIDLPSKPSSKYIVTSHSLQPALSAQLSPTSDSILCTAHALLETCCHMKAKLFILTVAYPGAWEVLFHVELCNVLHTLAEHGIDFIYHTPCNVSSQYNLPRDFHHSECRGDFTVYSTSSRIAQRTLDWGRHRKWSFAPFTVLDVENPSYWDALLPIFVEVMAYRVACVALPAEAAAEMRDERGSTLDDPGNDAMQVPLDEDLSKAVDREKDLLHAMPLPGTPVDEAERRRAWIAQPLRVRTAIRRMHRQFGHPSSTVLVQILRAARAPPEYIRACRHFRCDACEDNKPKHQSTKVPLPKDYVFGRNLCIDVLEIKDTADEPYLLCLNILDLGTTFQQVVLLRQGHGSPSSRECLDSFVSLWVSWAGWPQTLSCDRGVHNRGVFARTLAQHGLIRQAGVESPEQIGRVERHGGLFKAVLKRMITEHAVQGFDNIKIALAEAVSTKNNLSRNAVLHPHNGCSGPFHGELETNLMSRNSLTWDPCKDSSSQVPRSPDVQNEELQLVEHSYVKTAADELHDLC